MTNNNNNQKKTPFSKYKYGASAVVFTIAFVAFVVILNIALSVVENKTGSLTFSVKADKMFDITDQTKKAISNIDSKIEIVFCIPKDIVESNENMNNVKQLAEDYTKHFDNISIVYKDLVANPSYFSQLKKSELDTIAQTDIIVYCETTGQYRILDGYNMTRMAQDERGNVFPYYFKGEDMITAAIIAVSRKDATPFRAGIVTGHGENDSHQLEHFLEECGYEVTPLLDLKTTPREELGEYDVLIIDDPKSDFFGEENPAVDEIKKLTRYVQEDFGNVMVFLNPYTNAKTPNLDNFLALFGVSAEKTPVTDGKTGNKSGLAGDASFFGTYSTFTPDGDGLDYGYAIHKPLSESAMDLRPRLSGTCYITFDDDKVVNNLRVYPVIVTSDEAEFVDEAHKGKDIDSVPVITLSVYSRLIGQESNSANVFVCGSSGFLNELENSAVANADLLRQMLVSTGNDTIASNVGYKYFEDSSIVVDEDTTTGMMLLLAGVFPVIIAVIGVAVYVKRKYF